MVGVTHMQPQSFYIIQFAIYGHIASFNTATTFCISKMNMGTPDFRVNGSWRIHYGSSILRTLLRTFLPEAAHWRTKSPSGCGHMTTLILYTSRFHKAYKQSSVLRNVMLDVPTNLIEIYTYVVGIHHGVLQIRSDVDSDNKPISSVICMLYVMGPLPAWFYRLSHPLWQEIWHYSSHSISC